MGYTYKKDGFWFKKYMRYQKMEEKIKNIMSEVYGELIKLFGKKIERITLYGSYARGDFKLESDVDIMVSLLARNSDDYENNMKYQPFYQNIEKEGMRIYG